MEAVFTYAAIYQIQAVCCTPLRTGGADGDLQCVLRDHNKRAFIQGSSIAGALRGWLETSPNSGLTDNLFGNQNVGGHLIVSDAMFDNTAEQYLRPRLKIDPVAAVGEDGKKFDVTHIGAGSRLDFTLTWLDSAKNAKQELPVVEQMLAAMDAGIIRLGAQKSNGFGQLSLTVKKRVFDLTDANDRQAWLSNEMEGEVLFLPRMEQKREVVFVVEGHSDNLLVKTTPEQYKSKNKDGKDELRSYTSNLEEGGKVILPGSSVKGAVRGRCVYIAKLLGLNKSDDSFTDQYFGRSSEGTDNGLPSRVTFEDAELSKVSKEKISRIRVDRFTGGVFRGGLFTEEPVSSDLTLRITAPDEPELCGLLLYALRDLGLGLYNLGSGWAIGRGQIAVKKIQAVAPDGRSAALCSDGQGGMKLEDSSELFQEWLERLEALYHET